MSPEDFQQNNEHGGYPIVVQPAHSRALIAAARLSIVMFCVGFVAAFTPYRLSVGGLCPAGLAIFWIVGIIARRQPVESGDKP